MYSSDLSDAQWSRLGRSLGASATPEVGLASTNFVAWWMLATLNLFSSRTARTPTLTLDSLEKQFTLLLEVYHRRPSENWPNRALDPPPIQFTKCTEEPK